MNDFLKRTTSGIIGIILLVLIVNKGGIYLGTSILLLSIIGLREFYKAIHNMEIKPIGYIGVLGSLGLYISVLFPNITLDLVFAFITIILLLNIFNKKVNIKDITFTLLGILYIPFLLFHITYLDGSNYIWLVFIISFGTDTFAYLAGNLFGKNKLCPTISPKKTVEGAIGGIVGSLVLTIVFAIVLNINPLWKLIILSIFASVLSQLGDLVASKIKRIAGIKDYGFIMPGHGGVLDRFDSIILTAPVIYYYVRYFLY